MKRKPTKRITYKNLPWADDSLFGEMPATAKKALAKLLAAKTHTTPELATQFLEVLASTSYEQLNANMNEYFVLPGIGAIQLLHRKARKVIHPVTGETQKIPPKNVFKFRLAREAAEALQIAQAQSEH